LVHPVQIACAANVAAGQKSCYKPLNCIMMHSSLLLLKSKIRGQEKSWNDFAEDELGILEKAMTYNGS
jgi:hypothetical protein